jgi:DNA-binding transcriptional ArsR family regulator
MAHHTEALRLRLASGPFSGSQLGRDIGLSQPTVSRALAAMSEEVIKIGQRKTTRYALRDRGRGFDDIPVYRVDSQGQVKALGVLTPVRPDGFVFTQTDGRQTHSHGLPWWLLDMRPQGYLGRTYAARYGASLGLPSQTQEWTDSHALRALLMHGHDAVGNLLFDRVGTLGRRAVISLADLMPNMWVQRIRPGLCSPSHC